MAKNGQLSWRWQCHPCGRFVPLSSPFAISSPASHIVWKTSPIPLAAASRNASPRLTMSLTVGPIRSRQPISSSTFLGNTLPSLKKPRPAYASGSCARSGKALIINICRRKVPLSTFALLQPVQISDSPHTAHRKRNASSVWMQSR